MSAIEIKKPGIYVQVDGVERADALRDVVEEQGYFTEVVSQPDIEPEKMELCLIGWSRGAVDAVALGLKRAMGVSSGRTMRFDDLVFIKEARFEDLFPPEGAFGFVGNWRNQNAIRIGADDLVYIINKIIQENADVADDIIRLVDIYNSRYAKISGQKAINLDHQRDAFGSALELFRSDSLRREIFGNWTVDSVDEAGCFLETVKPEYCREDIIIDGDWDKFPGWEFLGDVKKHSKKLVSGDRALYITMANRTLIEECLGVDLIYYDMVDDRFVFVQYKNLKKTSGGSWECRPESEKTYKAEIARMRKANKSLRGFRFNRDLDNYRAIENPFFFKFCPARQLESRSTGLSDGFYVDLDAWELFLKFGLRGPRSGLIVTEKRVRKCVSNSVFSEFFNKGLIGSRRNCSALIKDIISRSLDGDRSVVTAFAGND